MNLVINILYYALTAVYVYIAIVVIITIVRQNRRPANTISWILLMILMPVIGIVIYLLCGRDLRRKKQIVSNKIGFPHIIQRQCVPIEELNNTTIPVRFHKLVQLLHNNDAANLYYGQNIEIYTTGTETFESLFEAINGAKKFIHIEFFIVENDAVGNRFRDILMAKAKEGVEVRLIYDNFGGYHLPPLWLNQLRSAGVLVHPFLSFRSLRGLMNINYRNHRKLVIIDGEMAFTGGINIAQRYSSGNRLGLWRDTFMKIEGAAVQAMQYCFAIDWRFVAGQLLAKREYFPVPQQFNSPNNYMQIVTSGPDSEWQTICQGIMQAISSAQEQVLIHTPYCIPPEGLMAALQTAALSGVDVKVMVPERHDSWITAAAGRTYIEDMLKAGIEVYYYQHNFLHSKAIVIDNQVAIVGTANMDNRSYDIDYEISAFIYDPAIAQELASNFEQDMHSCRRLIYNIFHSRKATQRFFDSLARLFSPLL